MIHMIGNAHLDPAWMWQIEEGFAAFAATCRSALERIAETPDLIFTCSSAAHYEWIEQTDAALFKRIQEAVRDDRWCLVGGWWAEADCNLPSGESLIRQAMLGQRYFLSRFGKLATVGYNIDSFGHNANMPQLLRKSGLSRYVFMRPEEHEMHLESSLFNWSAPSGDIVTAYRIPLHYSNHRHTTTEKAALLQGSDAFTKQADWMLFFGVGNHGGGPTKEQIAQILDLKNQGGIDFSDPEQFFADNSGPGAGTDALHADLQHHAVGCYSAHSEIKRLNRIAENAAIRAERMAVLAMHAGARAPRTDALHANIERAWKNICFTQFHDILGGVSTKEVCDEAIALQQEAISIATRSAMLNTARIASSIDTSAHIENLIVFNTSSFDREEIIEFELWHSDASERGEILQGVTLVDSAGESIASQKIEPSGKIGEDRVRFLASVAVPAFRWQKFGIVRELAASASARTPSNFHISADRISNEFVSISFDDSAADVKHCAAQVYDDPSDTWGHGITGFTQFAGSFKIESITVIERGDLRAGVRVTSTYQSSKLEEEYYLSDGADVIELRIHLDWREHRKVLKLPFAHHCSSPIARYEIPYASLERPISANEWPGQNWVDVSEADGSGGLAIVTDFKSSFSADDKNIYITAARSPLFAHHVPPHASMPEGERLRYLDQEEQDFRVLLVPHRGPWQTAKLPRIAETLRHPLHAHLESQHAGTLDAHQSHAQIKHPNLLATVMPSEEGIILRVAEQHGVEIEEAIRFGGASWRANFKPWEIKTFLIKDGTVTETDFLERPI